MGDGYVLLAFIVTITTILVVYYKDEYVKK